MRTAEEIKKKIRMNGGVVDQEIMLDFIYNHEGDNILVSDVITNLIYNGEIQLEIDGQETLYKLNGTE